MDIDPTTVIASLVAGMIALDKAGFWLRKRKGAAAVTKEEFTATIKPLVQSVERVEDKVDKHGERLAVVEAYAKSRTNGSGL